MPINIFGNVTSKRNNQGVKPEFIPLNTSDFVTKDQIYDRKFLNQNFINKSVIAYTSSYITLGGQRRIAAIRPGVDKYDAVIKSQMEDYVTNLNRNIMQITQEQLQKCITKDQLSRGKRSFDNSFLPYSNQDDDANFENRRLRNILDPIDPKDAVNLEYMSKNVLTKIYLTGKLKNETFILCNNKKYFLCLFKGTVLNFISYTRSIKYSIKW
jgi:hypothetical protein